VHGGADGPCPAVRKFALRETFDLAFGDLPWVRGIVPTIDSPEFPLQRALLTTSATVPQVRNRVQADGPRNTGQETPHYGRERGDRLPFGAHNSSMTRRKQQRDDNLGSNPEYDGRPSLKVPSIETLGRVMLDQFVAPRGEPPSSLPAGRVAFESQFAVRLGR
jgi:hypothetical protein